MYVVKPGQSNQRSSESQGQDIAESLERLGFIDPDSSESQFDLFGFAATVASGLAGELSDPVDDTELSDDGQLPSLCECENHTEYVDHFREVRDGEETQFVVATAPSEGYFGGRRFIANVTVELRFFGCHDIGNKADL